MMLLLLLSIASHTPPGISPNHTPTSLYTHSQLEREGQAEEDDGHGPHAPPQGAAPPLQERLPRGQVGPGQEDRGRAHHGINTMLGWRGWVTSSEGHPAGPRRVLHPSVSFPPFFPLSTFATA